MTVDPDTHDWPWVPLVSFASREKHSFVNGPFGSNLLSSELRAEGVPVIYIRDVKNGTYQRVSTAHVTPEKAAQLAFCQTVSGDVLVTKVGDPPCEAAVYDSSETSIVTQDVMRIHPASDADPVFLANLINSDLGRRAVHRISIEGTRLRVSLTDLKSLKLPLPPLPEQRKIAEILTTWDDALALLDRRIELARERKKGLMQRLLTGRVRFPEFEGETWPIKDLQMICSQVVSGGTPSRATERYWQGNIPWITGADFDDGKIADVRRCITPEAIDNSSTALIHEGELLVVTRTGVGKVAIAPFDIAVSQDITGLRPRSETVTAAFLRLTLLSTMPRLERYVQGTSIRGIVRGDLLRHRVPVPSLPEQRRIVEVLQTCDEEIALLERKRELTAQQKKGLMQRLLTERVRVKV